MAQFSVGVNNGADGRPLRQAIKQLAGALNSTDSDAFGRARRDYYRAMFALSANRELRRLVPFIQMPIVYAQRALPGLSKMRLEDYRTIAKAVLEGNEDAADVAGVSHVANIRSVILAVEKRD